MTNVINDKYNFMKNVVFYDKCTFETYVFYDKCTFMTYVFMTKITEPNYPPQNFYIVLFVLKLLLLSSVKLVN